MVVASLRGKQGSCILFCNCLPEKIFAFCYLLGIDIHSTGFSIWKCAIVIFTKREECQRRKDSVYKTITLPAGYNKYVGEKWFLSELVYV